MAYTVSFDQFSFDYELLFETAVYDDGYTRQEMPYHRIGAVKDNGYVLSDMEFEIETDEHDQQLVYLRKRFSHSISVDFNGRDYLLTADIVLRNMSAITLVRLKAGWLKAVFPRLMTKSGLRLIRFGPR